MPCLAAVAHGFVERVEPTGHLSTVDNHLGASRAASYLGTTTEYALPAARYRLGVVIITSVP